MRNARLARQSESVPPVAESSHTDVEFRERVGDESVQRAALADDLAPLQANLLARRLSSADKLKSIVRPNLGEITDPMRLQGMSRAVERLQLAIEQQQTIGVLTDYDVDGITGHAVIYQSLQHWFNHPKEAIVSLIGHRLTEGYGISESLVDRILASFEKPEDKKVDVIVTVDCGSSDAIQIARLADAGIDVIVTDHHTIPDAGPPASAFAVINPQQSHCDYPDKAIAGCMVAWLVMAALRNTLIENKHIGADTPKLATLLDYVALGTVADAVTLSSVVNRAVIQAGLVEMNRLQRPSWRACRRLLKVDQFQSNDLGFRLGPRINARGRVSDPHAALDFLLAEDENAAYQHWSVLEKDNQTRRDIEAAMTEQALTLAIPQLDQDHQLLVVADQSFHSGVQGIVASRLVERFGRPALVLSPGPDERWRGSARSVGDINIRDLLAATALAKPEAVERFGGHHGAAGVTIAANHLNIFRNELQTIANTELAQHALKPIIWTAGTLVADDMNIETIDLMDGLQPFGRGFEEPVFTCTAKLLDQRPVGQGNQHLSLQLKIDDRSVRAIWFRVPSLVLDSPWSNGQTLNCAFQLQRDDFRGGDHVQLVVRHAQLV
ncbi:MAG: single-stranded-DNA-specific exonuclease RecJ [Gammaproteobacteria bacterium]|nr:single-stranded-DNA-specific exonuclease RecJ [Gammaproteobacteria bacterium]